MKGLRNGRCDANTNLPPEPPPLPDPEPSSLDILREAAI